DTPGFRKPRQVKVEWIDLSRDSKATRDETRNWLMAEVASTTSNPLMSSALNLALLKQFPEPNFPGFDRNWGHMEMPGLNQPDFSLAMYTYKSLTRPETYASTIGLAAGTRWAAALSIPARASAQEARDLTPLVAAEAQRRVPVAAAY